MSSSSIRKKLNESIPGGIGTWYEVRRSLTLIAGNLTVGLFPDRFAAKLYGPFARYRRSRFQARLNRDQIVNRMCVLLGPGHSGEEITASVERYQEWHIEDQWARWRVSYKSDRQVITEVAGLENLNRAQEKGQGAVLWGMSFCGTLFSKIALSRVGVSLTQLSSADHGAWYPLTLMGKWIAGPLKCLPEGRYLNERIRIPVDGSSRYLFRIGQVLRDGGCIWIAAERSRAKRLVAANVLGRTAHFPVGAPMMALRHKAALLPSYTERIGQFHYRLTIDPPIAFDRSLSRDESVQMAVDTYAERLSAQILQHPGDFEWNDLWMQNLISNQNTT